MNAKYFLDTNIFIYALEGKPVEKAVIAQELLDKAIAGAAGVISYQVVQECLNVALTKAKRTMAADDLEWVLNHMLLPLCRVFPDRPGF